MYIYYKNQIKCGKQILKTWKECETNYILLIAQMQSGKTGVCRYVIENSDIKKEEIYYICGLNDIELREQIINDLTGVLDKSNILFSKQLNKDIKQVPKLILIDESHYACLEDSQIDLFYKKYSNSPDIFILSISATPMGEMAAITYNDLNVKTIILEPGANYYGIKNIFENELIWQAANLNGDYDVFIDIIETEWQRQKESGWKYGIIRLNNKYYFEDLEKELECYDIKFINHHNEYNKIEFNSYIKKPPKKMTIIWIYNSLRAGKQLNTENIGFIHDSYNTLTDTTAQSLLGRICGYNKETHEVHCYVDIKAAKRMLNWINYNYDGGFIPVKSKCILNGQSCNELNWKLHVPIFIPLLEEYIEMFYIFKLKYKNRYPYKNKLIAAILNSALEDDNLYNKVHKIINNYKFGRFGGLMVLDKNNAPRSFNENWNSLFKAYNERRAVRGFEVDIEQLAPENNKFYYIFCNLNINSNTYGSCLIIYKKWLSESQILYKKNIRVNNKSRFKYEL